MKTLVRFVAAALLSMPSALMAANHFKLIPTVDLMEVQDDNLNFSPDEPLRDRVQRISPALALRFDSPRMNVRASYGIDSERFATHSDLDNSRARERATVRLQYQMTSRLAWSLDSSYMSTNTPSDLNIETGFFASRARATRLSVLPALSYRVSPRFTVEASGSSVTTDSEEGVSMRSSTERLAFIRRVTPQNLFRIDYEHSQLLFRRETSQLIESDTILLGVGRDLSANSHWLLRAGPRMTASRITADVSASLIRDTKKTSVALSAWRSQSTIIGYAGAVETEMIEAKLSWRPGRHFVAYSAPAFIRSSHENLEGTVYRLQLGVRYLIVPALGVDVAYNIDRQNGAIDPLRVNSDFSHSTFSIGLTTRLGRTDPVERGQMR